MHPVVRAATRVAGTRAAHGLARVGFLAKAILYAVMGAFALRAAVGRGGATLDVKGALESLVDAKVGVTVVALVAAGIAGLGCWFVLEGVSNPGGVRGAWGMITRVGQTLAGLGYVALAAAGLRVVLGLGAGPSGDELARRSVAEAIRIPGGAALAMLVGLVAIGVGARQAHLGVSRGFLRSIDLSSTTPLFQRWVSRIGALGFAVQGTLFGMVGCFVVEAVVLGRPGEATSTGGALAAIARRPYGLTLLGAAAVGLLAYALYAGIEGACRWFPGPPRGVATRDPAGAARAEG